MEASEISEEMFNNWQRDPVTVAVRNILDKKRNLLRNQWEGGSFTDYTLEATVLTNVANMGTCRGYAFVQEMDYEDFQAEVGSGE